MKTCAGGTSKRRRRSEWMWTVTQPRATKKTPPHIACVKGVLADAVCFETGATRASLAFQANLEKRNARRADLVVTVSRYCAEKLDEFYGVTNAAVVPELINLKAWRHLLHANQAIPDPRRFTVLSARRFYPRKRLEILLCGPSAKSWILDR